MNRPKTYTAAAIVQLLLSALNIIASIPFLMGGAAPDAPPFLVELVLLATALVGLVSAYGIWRHQRWSVPLTITLCILIGLVNVPGLLFAPGLVGKLATLASLFPAIVIIALLLWPKPTFVPLDRTV
jgi:hypothetical protein